MIYLQLFLEFFKTGLFAVGGGLATLPFLSQMADKTGWFTQGNLADMIAISESTPGPIGVNMATDAGFITAGIPGSAEMGCTHLCGQPLSDLRKRRTLPVRRNPESDQAVEYHAPRVRRGGAGGVKSTVR